MSNHLDFGNLRTQAFALGNDERLNIVNLLRDCPKNVTDLLTEIDHITQSTLSHHLKILRKAGFVVSIRSGRHVYYAIRREGFDEINADIQQVAEQIPISAQVLPQQQ